MTLDTALLSCSGAVWTAVFLLSLGAIWRLFRKRAHYYDVFWALLGAIAFMVLAFNLRTLFAREDEGIRLGLRVYSVLLGSFAIHVGRSYRDAHRG